MEKGSGYNGKWKRGQATFPLLKDAPAARRGRLHVTDTPFRQALLMDRLEKGSLHVVDLAESATTGYK